MREALLVVLGLVACGDNARTAWDASPVPDATVTLDGATDSPDGATDASQDDFNDGATSGSRLKLVWYRTTDGVKTFLGGMTGPGYYDALRGEDCGAFAWADGTTYCTPLSMTAVYADAGCTTVLAQALPTSCATASNALPYIRTQEPGCRPAIGHLYQRGSRVTVSEYYTLDADGRCAGPLRNTSAEYYAAGAEVPSTALVAMTESAPQGSGRFQTTWWQTADGLRAFAHAYDSMLTARCLPTNYYAGGPVCIPQASPATFFDDATCSEHVAAVRTVCPAPRYLLTTDQSCPTPAFAVHESGPLLTPRPVYWNNGSTCATANPVTDFYSLGAEIAPAALQYPIDTSPGHRLKPHHFIGEDFSVRDVVSYDSTYHSDCQLQRAGDGSILCLPTNQASGVLLGGRTGVVFGYSDPACTSPAAFMQVYNGPSQCDPPPAPTLALNWVTTNGCSVAEVRAVGAVHTGPIYFGDSTGCFVYPPNPQHTYYDASTVIPNSSLVSATRVVDP